MILLIILAAILLVAIIGIAILITVIKAPESRGKRGENAVIYAIEHTKQGQYYLINDIIIVDRNGMSHQIDHIVINRNGLFVIETKNYSGYIYGNESQKEWTQVLAYGKVKNKLRNPVKQNKSHLYCLRNILPEVYFRPLVVFVQNNTGNIHADTVIPLSRLPYELTRHEGQILSERQMADYYNRILAAKSDITPKEHKRRIYRQQADIAAGICPRCGNKLVVRHRKDGTGSFYGCSSYPRCTFTKNID